MAFKKFLACFCISAFVFLYSFGLFADAPQIAVEPAGEERSDAELIADARMIQERLGLEPGNAVLYFQLSDVYAELFDRTRKKSPQSAEWLLKSQEALEMTVRLDPGHKVAHYNLGVIYKRRGKMEQAREEIRKAARLADPATDAPLLAACWMQAGMVYAEQGFYEEAEEAFLKAHEYDYGNPEIQEAIEEMRQKKRQPAAGGSGFGGSMIPASMKTSSMGGGGYEGSGAPNDQGAAAAQALPYLAQMVSQKFTGNQGGAADAQSQ